MLKIHYFTAQWCGPCKIFGPILTETLTKFDKIELNKIDADDEPETVTKFNIRAFPTIVIEEDGKELGRHVGLIQKAKLEQVLNDVVG